LGRGESSKTEWESETKKRKSAKFLEGRVLCAKEIPAFRNHVEEQIQPGKGGGRGGKKKKNKKRKKGGEPGENLKKSIGNIIEKAGSPNFSTLKGRKRRKSQAVEETVEGIKGMGGRVLANRDGDMRLLE